MKNANEKSIFINQIGYLPADKKIAYLTSEAKNNFQTFELRDFSSNEIVFTGEIRSKNVDDSKFADSAVGEEIFTADFSDFAKEGKYFIKIGDCESFSFEIKNQVYKNLFYSALNYFNLSRCGQGKCHTGAAEIYGTNEKKNVQGGWHDAGDYGRYVVPTAKTIMDLLLTFEASRNFFAEFDILAEVKFALEWLLQMQREDGAVYHKISCYRFCGFIKPEDEKDKLVISPISTAATADFAGCLAFASKFYKNSDEKFANALLNAALNAQEYLNRREDEFFMNPPEITTGAYGDFNVSDERYFALCAIWEAAQNEIFLEKAIKIRAEQLQLAEKEKNNPDKRRFWRDGFGWGVMSGFGNEILIKNSEKIPKQHKKFIDELKNAIISQAEKTLENARNSAFNYALKFCAWGSNGAICDQAHSLILAYELTQNPEFMIIAKAQIDFILGCNPLNFCYVTGEGTKSPKNPHHRPSGATKKLMPGMLVGGPCAGLNDEYARKHLANLPALKCYADAQDSYSTNEVAIYWNSAFVYVLARTGF